ncbi:sulfate reduction electron transfer complex DsrMKJOP subunit DsrJ [Fibrobacterota bacterium]
MNDKKWILIGLVIFLGAFTFPFWYNLGKPAPAPQPVMSAKAMSAGECVAPAVAMRSGHMQVLDEWRNKVVRQGVRTYRSHTGKEYHMSLSNTCLDCHANKEEFCDRCHTYASVKLYCWDCHVDPAVSLKEMIK